MKLLIFSACSDGRDADKYVGYWVESDNELIMPTEIREHEGKLYILVDIDGKTVEIPASFDEEGKSLHAKLPTPAGNVDLQVAYLDIDKKLKINIAGSSTDFSKISEAEAKERAKKIEDFYDPNFLVGKWSNLKTPNADPIEIRKEGEKYFLQTPLSNMEIKYQNRYFAWSYMGSTAKISRLENGNLQWEIGALRTEYKRM